MLSRIEAKLLKLLRSIAYFILLMMHAFILLPFVRIRIEGKENIPKKGRFILAANHQNFFDGYFISCILGLFRRPSYVIAKRSLKLKFWYVLAKMIGSVLINSENDEYQKAIKKLNNVLSHGGIVVIFPEGNVSKYDVPRKFKSGVAKLSLDSKSKVVPIYLSGTYNLRYLSYLMKRPQILIKVGKPIDLYNYAKGCNDDLEKMAMILREKIIEISGVSECKNIEVSNEFKQETLISLRNKSKLLSSQS